MLFVSLLMCVRHFLYMHVCVKHSQVESICNLNMYQLNGDIPTEHQDGGTLQPRTAGTENHCTWAIPQCCFMSDIFYFAVVINLQVILWHNNELRITRPSLFPRVSNGIKWGQIAGRAIFITTSGKISSNNTTSRLLRLLTFIIMTI